MSVFLKILSQLCGFMSDTLNPLETARACVETLHLDLAHLAVEAVTTDYFVSLGGLRILAPGERLRKLCVFRPSELRERGVVLATMPEETTMSTELSPEGSDEKKRVRMRITSANWYMVFVETSMGKRALVFLLEDILPLPKYRYFLLPDASTVEKASELCTEQLRASAVQNMDFIKTLTNISSLVGEVCD